MLGAFPRIFLKGLDGKGNLPVFDFYHFDPHSFAYLKKGFRVFYQAPINFRDVYQSFKSLFNFDEDAEINYAGDRAVNFIA